MDLSANVGGEAVMDMSANVEGEAVMDLSANVEEGGIKDRVRTPYLCENVAECIGYTNEENDPINSPLYAI